MKSNSSLIRIGIFLLLFYSVSYMFSNGMYSSFMNAPWLIVALIVILLSRKNRDKRQNTNNKVSFTQSKDEFERSELRGIKVIDKKKKQNSTECEYCGHINDNTREYCENCGALLIKTDHYYD